MDQADKIQTDIEASVNAFTEAKNLASIAVKSSADSVKPRLLRRVDLVAGTIEYTLDQADYWSALVNWPFVGKLAEKRVRSYLERAESGTATLHEVAKSLSRYR